MNRSQEFLEAEKFFLGSYFNGRWWKSLKKAQRDYFEALLSACPVLPEQAFNDWLYMSKSIKAVQQPSDIKLRSDVHALFIQWRNQCWKDTPEAQRKSLEDKSWYLS